MNNSVYTMKNASEGLALAKGLVPGLGLSLGKQDGSLNSRPESLTTFDLISALENSVILMIATLLMSAMISLSIGKTELS